MFGFSPSTIIKWVAILAVVTAISGGIWKYTSMVRQLAIANQTIEQLEKAIESRESALRIERALNTALNDELESLRAEKQVLEDSLSGITEYLPDDAQELAPESLRETIR